MDRNLLLSHLRKRAEEIGCHPDLRPVLGGDFTAIPRNLDWDSSGGVAEMINGYELAPLANLGECGPFSNTHMEAARGGGPFPTDLGELWLCLYFEHRAYHHTGEIPGGAELGFLNRLCDAFAKAACE